MANIFAMKKQFFVCVIVCLAQMSFLYAQDAVVNIKNWQDNLNKEYKTRATSPLSAADFKTFVAHTFYNIDTSFSVVATLVLTKDSTEIPFKTTSSKVQLNMKYADAYFEIKGQKYRLSVYQSKDLLKTKEYADYLFLPFIDETTGNETYGGGRYIDLRLPKKGNTIIIDFNKAYNPYCAYATGFSCPKVPAENELKLKVLAGVKYNPIH
jgi:uncharacterized protein